MQLIREYKPICTVHFVCFALSPAFQRLRLNRGRSESWVGCACSLRLLHVICTWIRPIRVSKCGGFCFSLVSYLAPKNYGKVFRLKIQCNHRYKNNSIAYNFSGREGKLKLRIQKAFFIWTVKLEDFMTKKKSRFVCFLFKVWLTIFYGAFDGVNDLARYRDEN